MYKVVYLNYEDEKLYSIIVKASRYNVVTVAEKLTGGNVYICEITKIA